VSAEDIAGIDLALWQSELAGLPAIVATYRRAPY